MRCIVCENGDARKFRDIESVAYHECEHCGSIFADPGQIEALAQTGAGRTYDEQYWRTETESARARSFGSSPIRAAETILLCRRPVDRFIDIGTGPGFLLDALATLMPASADRFHGVELYPPRGERSRHPHYHHGTLGDLDGSFSAGTCIEVIEHLPPAVLRLMLGQLAARSQPHALYLFNSGQPDYVKDTDPGYLDPHRRGHIVSYSLAGLRPLFEQAGFTLIPFPGRDWAFLAEYGQPADLPTGIDELLTRLWTALPENLALLRDPVFGPLAYHIGLEGARCYLEAARADERTRWALSLERQLH